MSTQALLSYAMMRLLQLYLA